MNKWIKKYMKLAEALANDNNACYSRKIGVFISTEDNRPVSFGYNGSISKGPSNDDYSYLLHLYENMLNADDKEKLKIQHEIKKATDFALKFQNCETCPRKLLNVESGKRLDLCNCSHAERNAIYNAARIGVSTDNSIMYCYCGVPCHECSIAIIQSGIKNVYCLETDYPDYSPSSRYLLKSVGVKLNFVNKSDLDD